MNDDFARLPTVLAKTTGNRLRFLLERLLLRGTAFRLLFIAGLLALLSLMGGLFVFAFEGDFASPPAAVWWAFLRMTDPGYLGDDEGALRRTVSILLTLSGSAIFIGALIAIITQWLNETIRNLEMGLTPITMKNHIVILGWTSRTPDVARDIVHAEGRVRRFLRLLGARKLRVVILAEVVNARTAVELREHLGASWADDDVILRSGTPLRHEHLMRLDFARAAVILLLAGHLSVDEVSASDTRTIKTILSVSGFLRDLPPEVRRPLLVAEIFDPRRVETARRAYRGPIEIIANDEMIGRLITQSVRKRGMSRLFSDIAVKAPTGPTPAKWPHATRTRPYAGREPCPPTGCRNSR